MVLGLQERRSLRGFRCGVFRVGGVFGSAYCVFISGFGIVGRFGFQCKEFAGFLGFQGGVFLDLGGLADGPYSKSY